MSTAGKCPTILGRGIDVRKWKCPTGEMLVENMGQGREMHSQWRRSMANIKIFKNHITHMCASSRRFRDINV